MIINTRIFKKYYKIISSFKKEFSICRRNIFFYREFMITNFCKVTKEVA